LILRLALPSLAELQQALQLVLTWIIAGMSYSTIFS
jgi:hypothetical protein